jgi:hypothetical protein
MSVDLLFKINDLDHIVGADIACSVFAAPGIHSVTDARRTPSAPLDSARFAHPMKRD